MSENRRSKNVINKLLGGRELVLVSNRGPVTFYRDEHGDRQWRRGAGGLITALDAALASSHALWVAAAMSDEDRAVADEGGLFAVPADNPRYQVSLVNIDPKTYDLYYNEISNEKLWFLQHYLFNTVLEPVFTPRHRRAWELGYVKANQQFARKIASVIEDMPEPIVMIQDYHLYLVGSLLRQIRPEARLLHFVHIPWPAPDYFRLLPSAWRRAILQSLLACDVIGFHSRRYGQNFMQCCHDFLGYQIDNRRHQVIVGSRRIRIKAYPISISAESLKAAFEKEQVLAWREKIKQLRGDCRLIVRIDRAELSKNLVRGFEAYGLLLKLHPELIGRVKFLAYAYPTRQDLPQYIAYQEDIQKRVARINDEFGTPEWRPIELDIEDNYDRSLAAMMEFDVLLTNPIFDGMNLVAKEAAVLNQRDGIIVLSENAGAYEELRDGVLGVNPFDIEETMERLYDALTMTPLERISRAARLKEIVERNDSLKWLKHQVSDIIMVNHATSGKPANPRTSALR
jgi:trehalose 6-phosphate synthase